jgi:hypothetical protein
MWQTVLNKTQNFTEHAALSIKPLQVQAVTFTILIKNISLAVSLTIRAFAEIIVTC